MKTKPGSQKSLFKNHLKAIIKHYHGYILASRGTTGEAARQGETASELLNPILKNTVILQEVERKEINVAAIKSAHLPIVWVLGKLRHNLKGQSNDMNILKGQSVLSLWGLNFCEIVDFLIAMIMKHKLFIYFIETVD
jgi:hypothetical protein